MFCKIVARRAIDLNVSRQKSKTKDEFHRDDNLRWLSGVTSKGKKINDYVRSSVVVNYKKLIFVHSIFAVFGYIKLLRFTVRISANKIITPLYLREVI